MARASREERVRHSLGKESGASGKGEQGQKAMVVGLFKGAASSIGDGSNAEILLKKSDFRIDHDCRGR
jgi:hypothetical protein